MTSITAQSRHYYVELNDHGWCDIRRIGFNGVGDYLRSAFLGRLVQHVLVGELSSLPDLSSASLQIDEERGRIELSQGSTVHSLVGFLDPRYTKG
jgi:hypothetical protein